MPRVLVVGDVMTDIVVRPEGPLAIGADTRASIRSLPGGSGANQACWLAHEGINVRFAARVGHDEHEAQVAALAAYLVEARLGADPALPTGSLVTMLSLAGERSFLTDRGANLHLDADDLPPSLLDDVDLLHISGYALFERRPRDAVLALIREARSRGVPFSVDPASYSFLREVGREHFAAWISGAHFLFPNTDEAEVLAGTADLDRQLAVLGALFPIVAIKRGAGGAVACDGGERFGCPAPQVDVLDTSGAGDAFLGGFLGAWLRGEGIEAALARGVQLGSAMVTRLGARPPAGR